MNTKQNSYICSLEEIHFRSRDTYELKMRAWEKIFNADGKQKKGGVTILLSDKTDCEMKTDTRYKEGHSIMIKG